jgi:flagellar protein FliS
MSYSSNPSQEYLKNAVLTASLEQLQLMLYDGAIRFATLGLESIEDKDRATSFNALERAQLIVLELRNGLRREINPDLADRMAALYNYIHRRLVDANLNQDPQAGCCCSTSSAARRSPSPRTSRRRNRRTRTMPTRRKGRARSWPRVERRATAQPRGTRTRQRWPAGFLTPEPEDVTTTHYLWPSESLISAYGRGVGVRDRGYCRG